MYVSKPLCCLLLCCLLPPNCQAGTVGFGGQVMWCSVDASLHCLTFASAVLPAALLPACQAGTVVFSGQIRYSSYEQWLADADKHCVPPGTPYSWQQGASEVNYSTFYQIHSFFLFLSSIGYYWVEIWLQVPLVHSSPPTSQWVFAA